MHARKCACWQDMYSQLGFSSIVQFHYKTFNMVVQLYIPAWLYMWQYSAIQLYSSFTSSYVATCQLQLVSCSYTVQLKCENIRNVDMLGLTCQDIL